MTFFTIINNNHIKMNHSTMNHKGTIYLRDTVWYQSEGVIKMGCVKDLTNINHIDDEVICGEYILVIEIPSERVKIFNNLLKTHFKKYYIYKDYGNDFYNRCINDLIEPFLKSLKTEYKVLSKEEIDIFERYQKFKNLKNLDHLKKIINNVDIPLFIKKLKEYKK